MFCYKFRIPCFLVAIFRLHLSFFDSNFNFFAFTFFTLFHASQRKRKTLLSLSLVYETRRKSEMKKEEKLNISICCFLLFFFYAGCFFFASLSTSSGCLRIWVGLREIKETGAHTAVLRGTARGVGDVEKNIMEAEVSDKISIFSILRRREADEKVIKITFY